ncbi:MAG: class I SAM-dependent methyltransferase [Solirubrobacterales bacterium]|nr:class I SAM-dependent methyltransferase [Solirubrobacterales bacterium]
METSNYEKFQTGNPVVRRLIDRFYHRISHEISGLAPTAVLDAGCGEGESLERLARYLPDQVSGVDLNPESVEFTRKRIPEGDFQVADILDLPFPDDSFDLVFCLEVLEHIPEPWAAVAELARVCRGDIVISVPSEPWFRLGSLARGKYLEDWGNHPEHINHWNPRSLREFLAEQVDVVTVARSTPWLVARVRPRHRI